MALERSWNSVPIRNFTLDGGNDGLITLSDVSGFRVKQKVKINSGTQPLKVLEVKKIVSSTQMYVGPVDKNILSRADLSLYLLADTASISAEEQAKNKIPEVDQSHYGFEAAPVVAKRHINVDKYGDFYDEVNPVPTKALPSGLSDEVTKKNALMDASDLLKTYTWIKVAGVDLVIKIVFTSPETDLFYGETIDLSRDFVYTGTILNTINDTLTII